MSDRFTVFIDDDEIAKHMVVFETREACDFVLAILKKANVSYSNILHQITTVTERPIAGTENEPKEQIGARATCLRCEMEIEYIGNNTWHDRGGNTRCSGTTQFHYSR